VGLPLRHSECSTQNFNSFVPGYSELTLSTTCTDGGQWDMAVNLLEKYGLVPQSLYPDSWHSSNSYLLDDILSSKLREYSIELREIYTSHLTTSQGKRSLSGSSGEKVNANALSACRTRKNAQMGGIYTILRKRTKRSRLNFMIRT
jgi:hypothetical protein